MFIQIFYMSHNALLKSIHAFEKYTKTTLKTAARRKKINTKQH